ncbi:hypothetical protein EIK77_000816 [Talaromyces pinophilus]|nr:hypothetical protein EIK77_000937 [Talaromyces pinophilus]PCG88977.1 Hypothetical protein PENO1_107230 [Penicillium occitanis (nom. inval.)]KAI7969252.1 hypothetical protein EIK77_005262 [Talaromyces pinophilus]KAI7972760.1 hypothetical protein EIK77_005452 [Talaromyces pinophilus]KAI7975021.1 hypothetical protein EIK77_000816 [Talaromyces pinophilus]
MAGFLKWPLLVTLVIFNVANAQLPISIFNGLAEDDALHVYVTGFDSNHDLVFLLSNGSWFYPDPAHPSSTPTPVTADIAIPVGGQGQAINVTLPGDLASGRVWFALSPMTFSTTVDANGVATLVEPSVTDPADPNAAVTWDFIELTYSAKDGLFANISYVDFVGLALGMSVVSADGGNQVVLGLSANATTQICDSLQRQAVGSRQPWDKLCVAERRRILSPNTFLSLDPGSFGDYYADYVDRVWTVYGNETLIVNTQGSDGNVTCTASGQSLYCTGDNRGYDKPTTEDIFGCNSGPFRIEAGDNDMRKAVVPRLCAAFERTTLLLDRFQPGLSPASYYTEAPVNYYSKFVHDNELDGRGYTFSYDDVSPTGEDQSGLITSDSPVLLTITVGGPDLAS